MAKTALDLTAEELRTYDPRPRASLHDSARWAQAWDLAREAGRILKESFGATRVAVFGSLAHRECFHARSDVDLAAWGIAPSSFFRAVAAVTEINSGIGVDLIDADQCPDRFRERIEEEGVVLP